ncbi:MAG: LamG-like jellyroll fold domain-containing protein, partial [Verrucomicrobiales bacterium]
IGGIRRGAPSHWITGLIDEVALWKRTLGPDEVVDLFTNGIPTEGDGPVIPLGIEVSAERLIVPKGQPAILNWEGNADATYVIEGIGDAATEFGVGQLEVAIAEETTFTVTATRDGEFVSGSITVGVREGIVPGWYLLDDYEGWEPGLLAANSKVGRKEYWTDPSPDPAGAVVELDGNRVMTTNQEGEETLFTLLQSQETIDGDDRTVFFRMRLNSAAGANFRVGLTNKSMRGDGFGGDTNGDLGGYAIVSLADGDDFGSITAGPTGDPTDFDIAPDTWYKVWLDITNSPGDSQDTISIHVAEDSGSRVTLVEDAVGDRGNVINHDRFYIAAKGENVGIESFYIDDVFVSTLGITDSDPLDSDDPNLAIQSRGIFGDVDSSGGPFVRTVPILNIGQTKTLNITGATLTGADKDLFTVTNPPSVLGAGEQGAITVTFTPGTRTGGVLAFLELTSDDQSNATVTVDLSTIVPSTNQLIGHYRMDEADGDVMLDSALLKHGTYVAVEGGAFELGATGLADGTGVNLTRAGQTGGGYAQARLAGGGLTSFSASMWIQPDDGDQSSLIAKGEQGGTPAFALLHNAGSLLWFNDENELTDPVGSLPVGEKSHIVLAYTDRNGGGPGADNLRLYINGEEALSQDNPPAIVDEARLALLIGSYYGTLSFDGIIDDVQIYAKSVTAEDAAFLFANPGQPLGENLLLDSDDDGVTDGDERANGTNPANPDT